MRRAGPDPEPCLLGGQVWIRRSGLEGRGMPSRSWRSQRRWKAERIPHDKEDPMLHAVHARVVPRHGDLGAA